MGFVLAWQRVRVTGSSMTPTLCEGDWVLVRHGAPVRAHVIALASFRRSPELTVIKRTLRPAEGGWLLGSDNPAAGTDSRTLGVADVRAVAVRVWHTGAGRPPQRPARRLLGHRIVAEPPLPL